MGFRDEVENDEWERGVKLIQSCGKQETLHVFVCVQCCAHRIATGTAKDAAADLYEDGWWADEGSGQLFCGECV